MKNVFLLEYEVHIFTIRPQKVISSAFLKSSLNFRLFRASSSFYHLVSSLFGLISTSV